jgi:septum formation protein
MKRIILASTSARRQELMEWLGIPYEVIPSHFAEESVLFDEFEDDPEGYVTTIATGKALTVSQEHPHALVIGSDTSVYLDGKMFGKPRDLQHAREMLTALRGKEHKVYSAVVMIDGETAERRSEVVVSEVRFFPFSDEELERYIATSEPYDKAGGYGMQGYAKRFIQEVRGSALNIIGFPLVTVRDMLEEFGVQIEVDLEQSIFEKTGYRS